MSDRFTANKKTTLLPFLDTQLKGWTRSKIKQRLKTGCVFVDGQSVTQYNYKLNVGSLVEVRASAKGISRGNKLLEILYSDRDLINVAILNRTHNLK